VTTEVSSRTLHVANGTCTTALLGAAGIPGRASIWADPLHDGPVPSGLSDDDLLNLRVDYLSGKLDGYPPSPASQDPVNDLRAWRAAIDDVASYDEIVLWFEHDLFDQLNLIQLLDHVSRDGVRAKPISLICVGGFPGHPNFKGLGELSPAEIGSLVGTRRLVGEAQMALANRAWNAFRDPDPRAIERLIQADTSALPFLRAALRRHLQEFPWTRDGLSRCERRLMTLAEREPIGIHDAFPRMHEGEDAFYIADGSFWDLAVELERASLVTIDAPSRHPYDFPDGTIVLTALGGDVLGGREDRIARCGIDRWIGAVHLEGSNGVWRWDDAAGALVPPQP
jgi:hypothetical protein